jgi:hypothetical protein
MMVTCGKGHLKFWPFQENGDVSVVKFKDKEDSFIIEGKSA